MRNLGMSLSEIQTLLEKEDIILIDKPAQHRDPALERRRRKKF